MDLEDKSGIKLLAPITKSDQEWLQDLWISEWGGESMVTKGLKHDIRDMDAIIAWMDGVRVGAASYRLSPDACELMSMNALVKGSGVGSKLVHAVEEAARQAGIKQLRLITTNDNLDALRFYQRLGYRIIAVYPGAVDEARKLKPDIPQEGYYGIPIHDEIELAKIIG